MGETFWREVLPDSLCKIPLAPITRLLKQQGHPPGGTPSALLLPLLLFGLLGSSMESEVADDHGAIKCIFHSLSPLLSLGKTAWEWWHVLVALCPRGRHYVPFQKG